MSFTPIHQFRPELQTLDGEGPSRFIALSNGLYNPDPNAEFTNYTGLQPEN